MGAPKQFLLASDELHAELLDGLIMARLRDVDGNQGSQWSGVFTDGTRFGVLWAAPASSLFGTPEEDPAIVIAEEAVNEAGESDWYLLEPVPAEEAAP